MIPRSKKIVHSVNIQFIRERYKEARDTGNLCYSPKYNHYWLGPIYKLISNHSATKTMIV